jgi:predicted DNA-binding transcriptional regulator AlpA
MDRGNQPREMIVPELLTAAEAARLCGLGERTFWRHTHSSAAPAPVRIGGSTRYRRSELLAWIAAGCPRSDGGHADG